MAWHCQPLQTLLGHQCRRWLYAKCWRKPKYPLRMPELDFGSAVSYLQRFAISYGQMSSLVVVVTDMLGGRWQWKCIMFHIRMKINDCHGSWVHKETKIGTLVVVVNAMLSGGCLSNRSCMLKGIKQVVTRWLRSKTACIIAWVLVYSLASFAEWLLAQIRDFSWKTKFSLVVVVKVMLGGSW